MNVEGPLAPGTNDDVAGAGAVHVFVRKASQLLRARVDCFQIANGKIDFIGQWLRRFATGRDIDECQNYWTAVDVMT
jgi:hypothetical protein